MKMKKDRLWKIIADLTDNLGTVGYHKSGGFVCIEHPTFRGRNRTQVAEQIKKARNYKFVLIEDGDL